MDTTKKEDKPIEKLDIFTIGLYCPGGRFDTVEQLSFKNKGLKQLTDIGGCRALRKLDLSFNSLTSYSGLKQVYNLTWISLSNNQITEMDSMELLSNLNYLNLSFNKIEVIKGLEGLTNLKALILNNNEISKIENLDTLSSLNTLSLFSHLLSHNKIKKIQGLKKLANLEKLSISHNLIRELTGIEHNKGLAQLRINDNKIMRVPETISSNPLLEILDLGNNRIGGKEYIKNLSSLPKIQQVNLKGNPMKEPEEEVTTYVKELCPKVLIINNKRVVPKKGKRKPLPSEKESQQVHKKAKPEQKPQKVHKKAKPEVQAEPEKEEEVFEVSPEEIKKLETKEREQDIKKQRSSGVVNIEAKKQGMKKKKVKERLIEEQQPAIEKWD